MRYITRIANAITRHTECTQVQVQMSLANVRLPLLSVTSPRIVFRIVLTDYTRDSFSEVSALLKTVGATSVTLCLRPLVRNLKRGVSNSRYFNFAQKMSSKLNFCANVSFLFPEYESILSRYDAAKRAGFRGVETLFPYTFDLEKLIEVKNSSGLEQILICSYPGNLEKGERGLAAIPGREAEFQSAMELSLTFAVAVNCKRIHIMSGILGKHQTKEEGYETLEKNLRHIIPFLESAGVVGLIEPINNFTIPGYFLNDFDTALSLVKSIGSPFIRLQLDVFHLQHIHGNLTNRIKEALPYTGHIQIAQVPHRFEMDTPGEIDYEYILNLIKSLNYNGWIGLEYNPSGSTENALKWIAKYGHEL